MFGIGGGELVFILFVVLMLFGSDKIPDIARTLGKGMAQLKNATDDIKSEIHKGAEANGLGQTFKDIHGNFNDVTANINSEINKAKSNLLEESAPKAETPTEEIDDITGPIKRQS
jgi:sec-independent protein translocase protein TatA